MKQILIILGLFASVTTFAQSPRIKLNQITKDSLTGSVLISSPTDSGMVYSRDLFISYGADTVLILGGDTLAATSSIISSVLSDGVTITGDGTLGSELTVDTATVIATKGDLSDYVTITGSETITGAKTFNTAIIVNEDGNNVDTRFEGDTDANLLFLDASTNRVGIGTSSPEQPLHINASVTSAANAFLKITDNTNDGYFEVAEGGGGASLFIPNFKGFSDGINDFGIVFTGGPNSAHDAGTAGRAAVTFEAAEYDDATNTVDAVENSHLFNFTNFGVSRMFIENSGDVGIATDSPSYKLHVNGSVAGVGAYNNLSDVNWKKNIQDITYGLDKILKLKPITFNWLNEDYGDRINIGFIAQEVEEIIPNMVTTAEDGTKSLAITDLIPVLTKAIQEQQAIVETQANEIETLKTLITELSNRLQILENN